MKKHLLLSAWVAGALVLGGGIFFFTKYRTGEYAPAPSVPSPRTPSRVSERFPQDKDLDGIGNEEEATRGTSDLEFDTDRDGLSDADEITVWRSDPTKEDTDGDGFGDAIEVIRGFNPVGAGRLP